ncbi:MAG: carboxypeptidase regulatory-like domain-containing protein [Planctomycetes bacterium]|nr:carboxypeptidase regulatory-like domain-containing protein [Planctomycetota bacterium]
MKALRFAVPSAVVSLLLVLAGCSSSGSSSSTPVTPIVPTSNNGTVSGLVADQAGAPLANVAVEVGSLATQTNEQGFFALSDVVPGEAVARFTRAGYVTNSKRVAVTARQNSQVALTLQVVGNTQTVDATQANTVTHRGGSVALPANGIVDAAGQPVDDVVVQVTTMMPGDPNFEDSMPGDFVGVDGGTRVDLISYGVVDVELTDASGNPLNLAAGQTADIEFPFPPNDPGDATIPLWWFDDATGDWIREGDAVRDDGNGVYRGTVTHFTPWNCDKGRPIATKVVRLVFEGRPVVGTSVRLNGNGWAAGGITDVNGEVTIRVSGNAPPLFPSSADVRILLPSGQWLTLREDETMPDPGATLINVYTEADGVVQNLASIVLQWGERPSDLDAHLTIPTELRSHVFFAARGALGSSPFAQLDTDDVTSFGPEIITVSQMLPGVYRYTVHNFSGNGSHPISDSGATITLVLLGQPTRVYTVPTENPSNGNYWAVFDLTVDGSGNVTVTDINQFGGFDILML